MLEAITARLIPSDATSPGAAEARASHYIDRALGGALASFRDTYRAGLASVDAFARASRDAVSEFVHARRGDPSLGGNLVLDALTVHEPELNRIARTLT